MKTKEVIINGPAGRIECKYHKSDDSNHPVALILHPHPQQGGTMNNKIVYNMFHSFAKKGFSVLRFNFRGVGRSEGEFDNGVGELLDAAIVLDWLQSQNPGAPAYWVAGFSFGSWVALQLLMRRPEVVAFIVAAPPDYDFSFLTPCPAPGLILQGTDDEVVSEGTAFALYEKLSKQKNAAVEYFPIYGANHLFEGKIQEVVTEVDRYISENLALRTLQGVLRKDRRRRQPSHQITDEEE